MSKKARMSVLSALSAGAALLGAAPAYAANFSIDPVVASLSPHAPSTLLDMGNTGAATLRFELSGFVWSQGPAGQIVLTPTDDMIFFPQLFALNAGEKRKVRIGTVAPAEDTEKSYRLMVAQMPSLAGERPAGSGVELLTQLSIPVFVEPAVVRKDANLSGVTATGRMISFQVVNTDNVQLVVEKATITGLNAAGAPAFSRQAKDWYVLAGKSSNYSLELTADECAKAQTIEVTVNTETKAFDQRVAGSPGSCAAR
jgi:fimbrial chaperone protein